MKQKSLKQLQKEVDAFNAKYKVGDDVKVKLDTNEIIVVKVEYPATILGGHSSVGWFQHPDISGCYSLSAVVN